MLLFYVYVYFKLRYINALNELSLKNIETWKLIYQNWKSRGRKIIEVTDREDIEVVLEKSEISQAQGISVKQL